jgi:predicted ATPase/DNA-binding XRE family transcriptional regulator
LRSYRLASGLSQEALAARAGLSPNGISALERGYRRSPQRETLGLLAAALSLDDAQRRAIEEAAIRSAPSRRLGIGAARAAVREAPAAGLPLALTSFVGRDREVAEIGRILEEHRLVTLIGAGGIGKTQTALHVAAQLGIEACFAGLAPVASSALILPTIASALGVQEVVDRPLIETLTAFLQKKKLLLILDNCEQVIAEAARVAAALVSGAPQLRMCATSREPLRIAGERSYRLPSLAFPLVESGRLTAEDAEAYAAVILFADRARAVDHRFALTDANAPDVAGICRQLDGIPLAIELAAARVNLLSVSALADRLKDRFLILRGGARTALPRQQTMRAAIDWSYELLAERERSLFERLSVFAGGCTLTTGAAVCTDECDESVTLNLLASLVDKSLVVADRESSEPRYRLLESFRQYARDRLTEGGEAEEVTRRHALAALELAEQLETACDTQADVIWRGFAQAELDNWRAALQWSLTDGNDPSVGVRLVGELHVVWAYFAPVEGRRYAERARRLIDSQTPPRVVARLGYAEAIVALQLRDYKVQLASSERALEQFRLAGDALGVARAQGLAGQALASLGRVSEARAPLEEALAGARRIGNRRLVASVLRNLGYVSAIGGDLVAARAYVGESVPIYEALGAELGAALAMDDLGECEFRAGNAEAALHHATQALATFRRVNHPRFVAFVLSSIAMYLVALRRYDEAARHAAEALTLAREQQQGVLTAWTLQHLAAIAAQHSSPVHESESEMAARAIGFVDARLAQLGSARMYIHEQEYQGVLAALREELGATTLARLTAEGAELSEEQIMERLESGGLLR